MNIVEFKKVTKEFLDGKIIANDNISFKIQKNEIHAIAGENGAGKSTLLSLLFGLYKPTSGSILVRNKNINYSSAANAINDGLGMVQQHFQLISKYTISENIMLGQEETKNGFLNRKNVNDKVNQVSKKYNFNLNATDKISSLTIGQEQKVEILKLLYRESEIMIFDEPTAMLTPSEIDELIKILLRLKKVGKTIIIITHKLDEIKRVADRVSIIRKGKYIGTKNVKQITAKILSKMMVGREIVPPKLEVKKPGKVILKIENLLVTKKRINKLKNFSIEIREGEIVSIAGVEGNGQVELIEAITGLIKTQKNKIFFEEKDISLKNIKFRNSKLSHIPENRHKFGMILDMKSYENIILKKIKENSFMGFINRNKMKKYAKKVIKRFDVRGTDGGMAIARGLSGGNQQKLVVGREIAEDKKLLVVFQATRGLDIGAINYIHGEIIKARDNNKAVLLVSYDLNEIMTLSDKIVVLNDGIKTGHLLRKDATREKIGILMAKGGK